MERIDLGSVPYVSALADMEGWVAARRSGEVGDRLFLLNHPAVITYGKLTPPGDLPADASWMPTVAVDRGGHATYHGPGQLIGYIVMNLRERGPGDVVRWLENGLIKALAELGFHTIRRDTPKGTPSLVGVWTPSHAKLVSIGMRIRGGITSHGFALNIDPDLSVYERFTACSLEGVPMTSLRRLAEEQGRPLPPEPVVRDAIAAALS
ncbi:lipoyl(octanoyl) transferase LipB [Actinoplanes sp. NPDC051513]|uniref:lipoyl(octanoyl) transferase LipB n=1 Tax=Actinoplanes sp. NPDC051513 TaxID=3363908 RepID=UPI0037950189